jgi:FKBP-type peptidyl-prolyl cis-trans isomerase (trigger factor)
MKGRYSKSRNAIRERVYANAEINTALDYLLAEVRKEKFKKIDNSKVEELIALESKTYNHVSDTFLDG